MTCRLAQAERLLQAEQAVDAGGPGQQHDGQDGEHVREQEHARRDHAGGPVVAGGEVLRYRRQAHAQVAGQEEERGCDHRDRRGRLPGGDGDGVVEGVPVQADQVFGREVGEHQRAGDDPGRQAAASKEVRVPGRHPVVSRAGVGNHRDQQGEAQERHGSHKHVAIGSIRRGGRMSRARPGSTPRQAESLRTGEVRGGRYDKSAASEKASAARSSDR